MSEEEKKTMEFLKIFSKTEINYCKLEKADVLDILNLIEQQQKEIEELKHKIKGKIKGLEKQQEDNRKELYNAIQTLNFRKIDEILNRISKNIIERDILKKLLEEK